MKDIIRWPGIVFALLLVCLEYFLLEPLLKLMIEETGSRALSTSVTLDTVQIDWSEQSLTLKGLEVADKEHPMTNMVEVDHLALQIDALDALTGHLISEQANILGIQFNTPRSESGVQDSTEKTADKSSESDDPVSLPGLDLPDIDSLVSKENSLTYKRYQSFRQYLDESKVTYKARLAALKDKQKIADYKARFKDIKKAKGFMEILNSASKAKDLKNDIDKDLSEAQQLNRDFKQTKKEVKRRIAELKNSPQQEADQLLKKVGVENGTQKISQLIFGPEMKAHIENFKKWINSVNDSDANTDENTESNNAKKPNPERGKGVFVQFSQKNPLPLVWFKNTQLSGDLSGIGQEFSFKGTATHLTDQQTLSGKPTSLDLDLKSDLVKNAKVDIVVDIRTDQKLSLSFDVIQYRLDQKPLSGNFTIDSALLDTQGSISSINDQLSGNINAELNAVSLKTSGDTFKKYPSIEQALADEEHITAKIALEGTLEAPKIDINSNLDSIFNSVLKKVVDAQLAGYKVQVTEKIETMIQQELNSSESSQSELLGMGGDIAGSQDLFKNLMGKL